MKYASRRLWDLPSAAILVIDLLVVCERLLATDWTPGMGIVLLLAVLGVTLGLALGISRFRPALATLLALAYSFVLVPLVAAGLIYTGGANWLTRVAGLAGRLAYSFGLFVARHPVQDTLLFIAFIGVGFWIISLIAGYALTRGGNFIAAVLPAGIALFIIQLYDPGVLTRTIFLGAYFFLSLLLLGRLTYVRKRSLWREQRVWSSSESATDLNLLILVIALVLVFLIWLAPVSGQPIVAAKNIWASITRPLQQARQDLGNAVAGLQGSQNDLTGDLFGDNLALGGQAANGKDLLFMVRVPAIQNTARYYWRVRTYDLYQNDGWTTNSVLDRKTSPNQVINAADVYKLQTAEFTFDISQNSLSILITPSHPVWISLPAIMSYIPIQNGTVEPVLFQEQPPLRAGEKYTIHAAVSNPTVKQLSEAGTAYPAWVTGRDLQLPADLPPAVADLARQVTAGASTPYEKAAAVTQYLRDNITYSKVVPPPPAGTDPLTWFLFDYKAGFCNYYASAEVVMLRLVGVPARLAVGFAEGGKEATDERIIRQQDTHAWPEVYFPGLGWVEFEPTASQPPLTRPSGATSPETGPLQPLLPPGGAQTPAAQQEPPAAGETNPGSGGPPNSLLRLTVIFGVLAAVIVGAWMAWIFGVWDWIVQRLPAALQKPFPVLVAASMKQIGLVPPGWLERWAHLASLNPIERSFSMVYRSLRWLRARAAPAQTPAEAAAGLTARLPEAAPQIHTLLDEYQRVLYNDEARDPHNVSRAAEIIRRRSLRAAVRRRLDALQHPFRKSS